MGNFKEDLKFGKIGEMVTLNYLNSLDTIHHVDDVTEDELWMGLDVDFISYSIYGDIYRIEVKSDRLAHKTGNLAYEVISNRYKNTIGCFEKTVADFMFYYLSETDEMYYINIELLRNYVHNEDYKLVNMGDYALGYLIKLNILLELKIAKKVK